MNDGFLTALMDSRSIQSELISVLLPLQNENTCMNDVTVSPNVKVYEEQIQSDFKIIDPKTPQPEFINEITSQIVCDGLNDSH